MDLHLAFQEGMFAGEGRDGYGEFTIKGRYDLKSGNVAFNKKYVMRDPVFPCRGCNEGKGIWGLWEISVWSQQGFVTHRGGFHIWPKGMADPTGEHFSAKEKPPAEVEEPILVGAEKE